MKIAVIAPPWLTIPPRGYGGIENVIYTLLPELKSMGAEVELFTVGDSHVRGIKKHWLFKEPQQKYLHRPQYDSLPVSVAHVLHALNRIRKDGSFDIIHDHNNFLGPLALAHTDNLLPPALNTLHNPRFTLPDGSQDTIPDHAPMWRQFKDAHKLYFVGISESLTHDAPADLAPLMLPVVHNGVSLDDFPLQTKKQDYFITLGRFNKEKGQHIAIKACLQLDQRLKMAGIISDIKTPKKAAQEVANSRSPYRREPDFKYFRRYVAPYLQKGRIEYVGEVKGSNKITFISQAKALLFPIQWDEPFGVVVIEALACGTPVIAMARGATKELIKHGYNGFLARNPSEFMHYMQRIDEINPINCRKSVEKNFSAKVMALNYMQRYDEVLRRHRPVKRRSLLLPTTDFIRP